MNMPSYISYVCLIKHDCVLLPFLKNFPARKQEM